jgi:hypothetical protein
MPKPIPFVILTNEGQLDALRRAGFKPSDCRVGCDNERFYPVLEAQEIPFEKIDEYGIREHWESIRLFGCGKAGIWIEACSKEKPVGEIEFASVLFLYWSVLLMHAAKNRIFADNWIAQAEAAGALLIIFEGPATFAYPDLPGNWTLNYFLKESAQNRKIPAQSINAPTATKNLFPETRTGWKASLRRFVKGALNHVYSACVRPPQGKSFMIYGSLRHLSETAAELTRQGVRCFYFDQEFHVDQYRFARSLKIPYVLAASVQRRSSTTASARSIRTEFEAYLDRAFRIAERDRIFVQNDYNFLPFFENVLGPSLRASSEAFAVERDLYDALLEATSVTGLLVEEDFHSRAFLAAFFGSKNITVFCNSHANLALDHTLDHGRRFAQSWTFVNSEHEREAYADRGWDPDRIRVTGTPRYDRMIRIPQHRHKIESGTRLRVLYCATTLWPYCPDVLGYTGCDIYAFGAVQKMTVRALCQAAEGLPIEIVIKPHYFEDEPMWAAEIASLKTSATVIIERASADYFELLTGSQAMVLSSWSSTLIEAGLAGVPCHYLDLVDQNSTQVQRLASAGLCEISRSAADLRVRLEQLCRAGGLSANKGKAAEMEYFLGARDAQATKRSAEFILNHASTR